MPTFPFVLPATPATPTVDPAAIALASGSVPGVTTDDLDYGIDVSCEPDLDPTFTPISGMQVVVAAVVRRWQTPRGFFLDDPAAGEDMRSWINRKWDQKTAYDCKAALEREALKDERVYSCSVSLTQDSTLKTIGVSATLVTVYGTFTLVAAITAVTITVLGITATT